MNPLVAPGALPKHFVFPCNLFAHREEHLVSTLLGSCVSVCLFDPRSGIGGMNHYMLPLWNGEGLATPKFGNVAMDRLLRTLLDLGCARERLVAKVFGGASLLAGNLDIFNVGQRNIQLAMDFLEQQGIVVAAREVGGERGMKIEFNTRTGQVLLARIAQSREGGPALPLPGARPRT